MGLSSHYLDNFGEPFRLVDESIFVVPAGGTVRLSHTPFKLLFFLKGTIYHAIEGLDDSEPLEEGDILVAPRSSFHHYINRDSKREARIHLLRLFFDENNLVGCDRPATAPEQNLSDFVRHHFNRPAHLKHAITTDIRSALNALRREAETRNVGHLHRAHSICTDLVILTARCLSQHPAQRRSVRTDHAVVEATEFIHKHFNNPGLRLGTIAWHTGRGEEHLARLFKRETGKSIFEYVREVRINHAKTLMLNPSLTLTEIAAACGFQSLAFFSRTFKQFTGQSPSDYRRTVELNVHPNPGFLKGRTGQL